MKVISIDPEIVSGTPCFSGTRVPIRNLFDALSDGESIGSFLEGFPTVTRQQVDELLRQMPETTHPSETQP